MDVPNLSAAPSRASAAATAMPESPARRASSHEPATGEFGGVPWMYRAGFDRVLETTPPELWRAPQEQGWRRVKQNARREVWRATLAGGTYYLKYYIGRSWLDRLKASVRGAECDAEWNGGMYALRAGIPATRPVGRTPRLIVEGRPCSLLVTAAIEPAQALSDYWKLILEDDDRARRLADRDALIENLAEMIARAHQAGFAHLDLHAANILVQTTAPRQYRTVFVDLQSARLGAALSDEAVVRNLTQLNQWFRKNATLGDRIRFLRAYLRWRNEFEHAFEHGRSLGLTFR